MLERSIQNDGLATKGWKPRVPGWRSAPPGTRPPHLPPALTPPRTGRVATQHARHAQHTHGTHTRRRTSTAHQHTTGTGRTGRTSRTHRRQHAKRTKHARTRARACASFCVFPRSFSRTRSRDARAVQKPALFHIGRNRIPSYALVLGGWTFSHAILVVQKVNVYLNSYTRARYSFLFCLFCGERSTNGSELGTVRFPEHFSV